MNKKNYMAPGSKEFQFAPERMVCGSPMLFIMGNLSGSSLQNFGLLDASDIEWDEE